MSKVIQRLFPGIALGILLAVGVCMGGVKLVPPEVEVSEGDRLVDLLWRDLEPESLVVVNPPVLGSIAFPWNGGATLSSEGFYLGACDWTYDFLVSNVQGSFEISWQEIIDWKTGTVRTRRAVLPDVETFVDASDGIRVKVDSTGLFLMDATGWEGPVPVFHGLYTGGTLDPEANSLVYSFTCTSGGELTAASGNIGFSWANSDGESGTITATQADTSIDVDNGFKVTFRAGSYTADQVFAVEVVIPLVGADRFSIRAETFEGYLVIRKSVEDTGDLFKVRANISKCDTFEFFQDESGEFDPWGERTYRDRGVVGDQPGVTPNPELETVLNGFPYQYSVVAWDWSKDHQQVLSEIRWQSVIPSVPPDSTGVDRIKVVPNPYVLHAGWEVDDSKLLFVNVPADATIRIYDAAGGYVNTVRPRSYSFDESLKQGSVEWNLRNEAGKQVASGIYMFHVESKLGESLGRFIIVR